MILDNAVKTYLSFSNDSNTIPVIKGGGAELYPLYIPTFS